MAHVEKELKKKKQAILDLSEQISIMRYDIEKQTEKMDILKEEVRGILQELDINFIKNDKYTVSISYPSSVDPGILKINYPKLYDRFIKVETIIKTSKTEKVIKGTKEILRSEYKNAAIDAIAEGTPRLRITNIQGEE